MTALTGTTVLSVAPYLARIGYTGPLEPTHVTLRGLCEAHADAVPFETLDAPEGRTPSLDTAAVHEKVVTRRGGGACIEVNALLAEALRALGFTVDVLAGRAWRVLEARYSPLPDHMILAVTTERGRFLVDLGFATLAPVAPVRLDGTVSVDRGWSFRVLTDEDGDLVAQRAGRDGRWAPIYRFSDAPCGPEVFEQVRDHYLGPAAARMRTTLLCGRWTPRGRVTLVNTRLLLAGDGVERIEPVVAPAAARAALEEIFRDHPQLVERAMAVWRRLFAPDDPSHRPPASEEKK